MQDRLKTLIEANLTLARIESLSELLPQLMALGKSVTNAEAASVMLYNPQKNVLEFDSLSDDIIDQKAQNHLKKNVELKLGDGIAGWVAERREPLIVRDAQKEKQHYKQADVSTGFLTRNLMAVPILNGNELLGVIEALNCRTKPCFDDQDLEILECFANLAAVAIVRSRLMDYRLKQQKYQVQMDTAAKIQALFLPESFSPGTEQHMWAMSEPAEYVGGDLYDIVRLPDGGFFFYVGDVSDKGLPAALIMAALSSMIKAEVLRYDDVALLIEAVNTAMYDLLSDEGYFATMIAGKFWSGTGQMQIVNAGHLPPIWIRQAGPVRVKSPKSLPIGVAKGARYCQTALALMPGERVLFISDGVTEAENRAGELFGDARLDAYLSGCMQTPMARGLIHRLNQWRDGAETNDDVTLLEIWR